MVFLFGSKGIREITCSGVESVMHMDLKVLKEDFFFFLAAAESHGTQEKG